MSILARRVAASEGAYFFEESKHLVHRLSQTLPPSPPLPTDVPTQTASKADVLPEILRHSVPLSTTTHSSSSSSSFNHSKWVIDSGKAASSRSLDASNPLRAYVSLPQVTFGPRRWQLPDGHHSVAPSTANDLRRNDSYSHVDPEKLRAAAVGLSQIGKAFAVATMIVFGGATLVSVLIASKLQLQNIDDIESKGRDALQPRFQMIREKMDPIRSWAEKTSMKWRVEGEKELKEKPLLKEFSRRLGGRTAS
ncbi:hypothetical protein QJS04_geneDACA019004 [Acorus gramineus]|uniref:Uncharacterized protein n=1 Tax=Acorus gramineus TaxID=55184 RepID=A0AAV9BE01_ACOGR|nr:hypothetical protein QJS04_geneDACA019004 [Acorus gramineus]